MDIFPELIEIENIGNVQDRGVNFLFDFNKGDFVMLDGKFIQLAADAGVVFWIEKTIRTEYEISSVYKNTGYGTSINELKGTIFPREITKSILESNVKDALLQHERIETINFLEFSHVDDKVNLSFEVILYPLTEEGEDFEYTSEQGFTRLTTLEEIKDFIGIQLSGSNSFVFSASI